MILIGDDTEFDSDVYSQISAENPDLVQGIYIRAIQDKVIYNQNFFSAVEIAGAEVLKGNLTDDDFASVANGFINQENCNGIVLKSRYCPAEGRKYLDDLKQNISNHQSIELLEKTQAKIISTCH